MQYFNNEFSWKFNFIIEIAVQISFMLRFAETFCEIKFFYLQ